MDGRCRALDPKRRCQTFSLGKESFSQRTARRHHLFCARLVDGLTGYEASVWLALLAPAGTPRDIVTRLNTEIGKLMNSPETRKALVDAGVEVAPSTPEAMADYMVLEMERWGKVVKETGIKLE